MGINKKNVSKILGNSQGILVPGGFGNRGIEGMIQACEYARINKLPYFGICLGMQVAVIEAARNLLGLKNADSTEFAKTKDPVIGIMTEWIKKNTCAFEWTLKKYNHKTALDCATRLDF